jgi:hypothetical protein
MVKWSQGRDARKTWEATKKATEGTDDKPWCQGNTGVGPCYKCRSTLAKKGAAYDEVVIGVIKSYATGDRIDFIAA